MNRSRTLLLLAALFFVTSFGLHAQGTGETPYKIPPALTGTNGHILVGLQGGAILRGTAGDGVVTITDTVLAGSGLPANVSNVLALTMPDKQASPNLVIGLVSISTGPVELYGIIRSTDMGATWESLGSTAFGSPDLAVNTDWWYEPVSDFYWLDGMHGWLYGKRGIISTTDGGTTWHPLFTTDSVQMKIWGLAFEDANTGTAMMGPVANQYIMRTTDGGTTWRNAGLLAPKRLAAIDYVGGEYRALAFDRFQTSRNTSMYFSSDGTLFMPEYKPVIGREQSHMSELLWASPGSGYMVLRSGEIWETTNGGHAWTSVQNADSTSYPVPVSSSRGWGQRSMILDNSSIVHVSTVSNNGSIYRLLDWPLAIASVDAAQSSVAALQTWPNPVSGALQVAFHTKTAGSVTLELVDAMGRTVLTRRMGQSVAGDHQTRLSTDGIPQGAYRLVVYGDGAAGVASTPVTILR